MPLSRDQISFTDEMAGALERAAGLPRMAGRLWAVLLISEEEYLSAEELMDIVHASRGSVSTMVRILEGMGLVKRVSLRGDRKYYYRAADAGALLRAELASVKIFIQLTETGLRSVVDERSRASERLGNLHDLMHFIEQEYTALLERWHKHKAE